MEKLSNRKPPTKGDKEDEQSMLPYLDLSNGVFHRMKAIWEEGRPLTQREDGSMDTTLWDSGDDDSDAEDQESEESPEKKWAGMIVGKAEQSFLEVRF